MITRASVFICGFLLSVSVYGQTPEEDKATLIPVLLSDYEYQTKTELLVSGGEEFKIEQFDLLELGGNHYAVIWIQSADQYDRFNEVRICRYRYLQKKKTYEKIDDDIVRNQMLNTLQVSTLTLLPDREVIEVTTGYDSDGDGDEIFYYLYGVFNNVLTKILDHELRNSSGDGCDGSSMESVITVTETLTEGFPDLSVEESGSSFNNCDENNEESCTKNSRWTYVWRGAGYSKN
jgi:hypothetical protein